MSDTTAIAGHPAEPIGARLAAVFLPAPLPREGRIAFWDPDEDPLPDAAPAGSP
ncbi:hypothetical protein [Streptomyces bobili]